MEFSERRVNGKVRRVLYFRDWPAVVGFELEYRQGAICGAWFEGREMSRSRANFLPLVSVWVDEQGVVHVEGWSPLLPVDSHTVRARLQSEWDQLPGTLSVASEIVVGEVRCSVGDLLAFDYEYARAYEFAESRCLLPVGTELVDVLSLDLVCFAAGTSVEVVKL